MGWQVFYLRGHSMDTQNKKGVSSTLTPCFSLRFGCGVNALLVKTLFDTSSLTSTLTQVVQFSFTNSTTTFDRNAVNYRRVSLKTRSTPSPLEILRTVNAECRPRLRIAITTPSNACRRFWNLQQPILSLPRYHPDGRKVRPASSALVQVA